LPEWKEVATFQLGKQSKGADMNDQDEQRRAAEDLATVRTHQERARRAARLPWWLYAVMFVLAAGGGAINDFVSLSASKLIAIVIVVALVVVLVIGLVTKSAPLSTVRGVQRQQSYVPWAFAVMVIAGGFGAWLIYNYGPGFSAGLADAIGLHHYPDTVAGVIYAAVFTALFALSQLLVRSSHQRTAP
jgi:hypothetical protein